MSGGGCEDEGASGDEEWALADDDAAEYSSEYEDESEEVASAEDDSLDFEVNAADDATGDSADDAAACAADELQEARVRGVRRDGIDLVADASLEDLWTRLELERSIRAVRAISED